MILLDIYVLLPSLQKDAVVLLQGSRRMRMDRGCRRALRTAALPDCTAGGDLGDGVARSPPRDVGCWTAGWSGGSLGVTNIRYHG